jgi:hypothetical protein
MAQSYRGNPRRPPLEDTPPGEESMAGYKTFGGRHGPYQ